MKLIEAYEESVDKSSKETSDILFILHKLGCNNVELDPSQQIWGRMIRIMLKNGSLKVEDFK